ncbi:hypothetical protein [Aquabacterium humicola]|uniref:hypothetical protein n=1 Tax=Aquabacterium humicola TaxID=3237377 RepID=UPI002542FE0F|nr:hypothetical protein [Rubrivivax pictus]
MATTRSPFRDNALFQREITAFLAQHQSLFSQQIKKTSAFFEIACYNDLVKFYENTGFAVKPENAQSRGKEFVYALSPSAKPERCSYFVATRTYQSQGGVSFEIRHNVRVQSAHDAGVFVSPDYVVINPSAITSVRDPNFYNGKVDYDFVPSSHVQTFAETKHYPPGPELILNFVGLVNELLPHLMTGAVPTALPKHLGPSLFISGVGNAHHERIRDSLAKRYSINVFLGLFARRSQVYAKGNQSNLTKVGTR